jgi:hypothetical protein
MSSFGSIAFQVYGEDGAFPGVTVDSEGIPTYAATVHLASRAAADALLDARSLVTVKRVLGTTGLNAHIEAGAGVASLTVPHVAGGTAAYQAILTAVAVRPDGRNAARFVADVEFVIVGTATP